jgi:hypothetical protein
MRPSLPTLLILGLLTAACGDQIVIAPSAVTSGVTNLYYTGTLDPQGSGTYSFNIAAAGPVAVALVSVASGSVTGPPVAASLSLGLGTTNGTTCTVTTSLPSVSPSFVAPISATLATGIFCVRLADDAGALGGTVGFVVRISQGSPNEPPAPGTDTFVSNLTPLGATARFFTVTQPGTIFVTLSGLSGGSTLNLGLGSSTGGAVCSLAAAVDAAPDADPQIALPADPGNYCVNVADDGTLKAPAKFTIQIGHP